MELIIDSRELDLRKIIDINYIVKQLDLGDIIIKDNNNIILIIERKTCSDLIASIKDGRYHDQKSRLLLSSTKIIYIIEGQSNDNIIIGSIVNTMFRDDIMVIKTQNISETWLYIKNIYNKYCNNKFNKTNITNGILIPKKINNPQECYIQQLCCIPMISSKTAQDIANKYPNMIWLVSSFQKYGDKLLCDINGIGKKKSSSVYKYIMHKL